MARRPFLNLNYRIIMVNLVYFSLIFSLNNETMKISPKATRCHFSTLSQSMKDRSFALSNLVSIRSWRRSVITSLRRTWILNANRRVIRKFLAPYPTRSALKINPVPSVQPYLRKSRGDRRPWGLFRVVGLMTELLLSLLGVNVSPPCQPTATVARPEASLAPSTPSRTHLHLVLQMLQSTAVSERCHWDQVRNRQGSSEMR